MDEDTSQCAAHELFIKWARDQGISVGDIRPVRLASRGIGLVAQRNIRVHHNCDMAHGRLTAPPGRGKASNRSRECVID